MLTALLPVDADVRIRVRFVTIQRLDLSPKFSKLRGQLSATTTTTAMTTRRESKVNGGEEEIHDRAVADQEEVRDVARAQGLAELARLASVAQRALPWL